jgi:hypothetical protein
MDPGFSVVSVGPWTFFVAALDKVQYDYHPHVAHIVTINVPCVFMARYVMILRGQHHYEGHRKGCALKIETVDQTYVPVLLPNHHL